ncbi:hypothetical protein OF83DRAFT_1059247, partial [Amylostereum chailletii]
EQLEHLSSAAHLLLALYTHGGAKSRFLPTMLYVDLMIMIKNAFFSVAKAKVDHPDEPFYLILLGTDRFETLFRILRTMVGNDANLDVLQLALRVTGTTEVANILARHPEWDRSPRCLRLPSLGKDLRAVPGEAYDHINPASWRADLLARNVTLATCWRRGQRAIEEAHPFASSQLHIADGTHDASILSPLGTHLCLHTSPSDPDNDSEFEEAEEAECLDGGLHEGTSDSDPTAGMRELEEAAVDSDWRSSTNGVPFTNTVDIDGHGTMVNKSRALSQRFKYSKTASSTDRLRRVQHEDHYTSNGRHKDDSTSFDLPGHEGPFLGIHDPIASLVLCNGNLFLCIGEVNGIQVSSKPVEEITTSLLPEKTVSVSYQIVTLVRTTDTDDPSLKFDWRSLHLLPISLTAPGILVHPINPYLATHTTGRPFYLFESSVLMAVTSSIHARTTRVLLKSVPKLRPQPEFLYRELKGMACFVAEGNTDTREPINGCCPRCTPKFSFDGISPPSILQHVGSHILHNHTVDRTTEPCGLCLNTFSVCQIYLSKNKGHDGNLKVDWSKSTCTNITKFSYSVAAKSSRSSPCSNVPLSCSLCPPGSPAIWCYNFRQHLMHVHPHAALPKYRHLWTLSKFEETEMKDTWRTRHKRPNAKKNKNDTNLVISEAHSSRLVLR